MFSPHPNLIPCLSFTGILTPHVLSEWMVEVCRFEVCWNRVGCFVLVFGLCFKSSCVLVFPEYQVYVCRVEVYEFWFEYLEYWDRR